MGFSFVGIYISDQLEKKYPDKVPLPLPIQSGNKDSEPQKKSESGSSLLS